MKRYLQGLLLVAGLALAGGDGEHFPYFNMIGAGCLCVFFATVAPAGTCTGTARRSPTKTRPYDQGPGAGGAGIGAGVAA